MTNGTAGHTVTLCRIWLSLLFALLAPVADGLTIASPPSFVETVTAWLDAQEVSWRQLSAGHDDDDPTTPLSRYVSNNNNDSTGSGRVLLQLTTPEGRPSLFLHLLPSPTRLSECLAPDVTHRMTNDASSTISCNAICLHQDVWQAHTDIVRARLLMKVGQVHSQRIYARKTQVRRITAALAIPFLQEHHLWSATKAKYYYGLFLNNNNNNEESLVAVATFSARRRILRDNQVYQSHELLRFCTQKNGTVVGGITKLLRAFCRDHQPDDLVTVVDRDWGPGTNWNSVGFTTTNIMPPMAMVVGWRQNPNNSNNKVRQDLTMIPVRRHLVGAGIFHPKNEEESCQAEQQGRRIGLDLAMMEQLDQCNTADEARVCLAQHGWYPVYDAGVERLFTVVNSENKQNKAEHDTNSVNNPLTANELWKNSVPKYTPSYYSPNRGILALLEEAEMLVSSAAEHSGQLLR